MRHVFATPLLSWCNLSVILQNGVNVFPLHALLTHLHKGKSTEPVQHCSYTGACNHIEQNIIDHRRYVVHEQVIISSECKPRAFVSCYRQCSEKLASL